MKTGLDTAAADRTLEATVILPTFSRPEALGRALQGLVRAECESRFEVLVVDDGSPETEAAQIAEQVRQVQPSLAARRIRHDHNRGVSAARNTGAAAARGSVLVFLDDDLVPESGFVSDHLRVHREHPEALIICGHLHTRLRNPYARLWAHCYDSVMNRPAQGRDFYPIPMLSSGNVSIKRALLARLQPLFDPDLPSREDFDLYLRAQAAGIPVYKTLAARAENPARRGLRAFCRQRRWYAAGEAALRRKHGADGVVAAEARARVSHNLESRLLLLGADGWERGERMWRRVRGKDCDS